MMNRKANISMLYHLSLFKQADSNAFADLTKQQKDMLIDAKESALENWFEVDIAIRQATDLGLIPNWIINSISKLKAPAKELKTITVSAGYTESHEEFVKQAQLFNELFNEYMLLESEQELSKNAGVWDTFKEGVKGIGSAITYGGKAFIVFNFLKALYDVYFVYEKEIDSRLKKYSLNITSWETISNPEKIKQNIIKYKQNPEIVLALVKIAEAAKGWILGVIDIIFGVIDIVTDILGVAITGATFGMGAGAAIAINSAITLLSLFVSFYGGPVGAKKYFGSVFSTAQAIAKENIEKLQLELKTLKPSLEEIFKSFEEDEEEPLQQAS